MNIYLHGISAKCFFKDIELQFITKKSIASYILSIFLNFNTLCINLLNISIFPIVTSVVRNILSKVLKVNLKMLFRLTNLKCIKGDNLTLHFN